MEEFKVLDKNNDGKITLDEIEMFLQEKAGDVKVESEYVQKLFQEMDKDGDMKVDIDEFVNAFFYQQLEV